MRFHLRRSRPDRPGRPLLDAEDAAWIGQARFPFDSYAVGSLVPVVFERYVRVLHPAWAGPDARVRWSDVAAWSGRTVHGLAQWEFLVRPLGDVLGPGPFIEPPREGGLPPRELQAVCRLLAAHTTTPSRCFFGVWDGYGGLTFPEGVRVSELRLDQRAFLVTEGPIGAIETIERRPPGGRFPEPPTLIWPADRAWFLASDVDLDSTYIGGCEQLIAAVRAELSLETWPANPTDGVSITSDSINATHA
jgi:hypothetical protein